MGVNAEPPLLEMVETLVETFTHTSAGRSS
jgi:hypothetical protein